MTKIDSVTLRQKKLKDGRMSLYLDYYTNGAREYEFLKLYLSPHRSDKEENKRVMQLAEAIRAKRLIDIQNNKHGFVTTANVLFLPYAQKQNKPKVYPILATVFNDKTTFTDLDKTKLKKLRDYINNIEGYKQNTKNIYWTQIKTILHRAEKEGLYDASELKSIDGIRAEEAQRQYLTLDEVKRVAEATLTHGEENARRMFMFSCCTGLRWSDVSQLTWGDIVEEGENVRIIFRQQKTRGQEYLDISKSALEWLPERKNDTDNVFTKISLVAVNKHVGSIMTKAEINKHVSFHCARHTFACMMIDLNTDIYTISKLLGHRNISTTQIYAKIRDKQKQEAVSKIPSFAANGTE